MQREERRRGGHFVGTKASGVSISLVGSLSTTREPADLVKQVTAKASERCRAMLHVDPPEPPPEHESFAERCLRLTGTDPTLCPACGEGRLVLRAMIPRPRFADLVARPAQSMKSPWAAASRAPPS